MRSTTEDSSSVGLWMIVVVGKEYTRGESTMGEICFGYLWDGDAYLCFLVFGVLSWREYWET